MIIPAEPKSKKETSLLAYFFASFLAICFLYLQAVPTSEAEETVLKPAAENSGVAGTQKSKTPAPPVVPDQSPKKSVAILPIQKAFSSPLYLSIHPGLLTSLKRVFTEKEFKLGKMIDYDPDYVPKTLSAFITQDVFKHDYLVFLPEDTAPEFEHLTLFGKEFPIESLTQTIHADAFLLITLTEWDAENFDRSGTVKVGFDAALIDAKSKRPVWTNRASGLTLRTPSKDFLYSKYQKEVLHDLASRILKSFPKKSW